MERAPMTPPPALVHCSKPALQYICPAFSLPPDGARFPVDLDEYFTACELNPGILSSLPMIRFTGVPDALCATRIVDFRSPFPIFGRFPTLLSASCSEF